MKYRKKPVVIEAVQFFKIGDHAEVMEAVKRPDGVIFCHNQISEDGGSGYTRTFAIPTWEGCHEVTPGDWIICGIKGEFYPCKPDIFEMTYEPATRQPLREMPEGVQASERVITCACGTKYKLQIFAGGGGGEPGIGYTSPDTGYVASENTCIAPAGKPEMPEAGSRSCGCDCPKKHCVPTAIESHYSPRGGEVDGK